MKEEDRKLWTNRIKDYRASGLTAVMLDGKIEISNNRAERIFYFQSPQKVHRPLPLPIV